MEDDIRRELDQLHQADRDLRQSINDLDNHGSRGVLQLQGQITDLIKDFGELKVGFVNHEKQHQDEAEERRSNKRWIIGTIVAGLGGFGTVIGFLLEILKHIH